MQIGVPYFIAGITMFIGCYIGCCCKSSVPQPHAKVEAGGGEGKAVEAVPTAILRKSSHLVDHARTQARAANMLASTRTHTST